MDDILTRGTIIVGKVNDEIISLNPNNPTVYDLDDARGIVMRVDDVANRVYASFWITVPGCVGCAFAEITEDEEACARHCFWLPAEGLQVDIETKLPEQFTFAALADYLETDEDDD